jgi:hypothetical protein
MSAAPISDLAVLLRSMQPLRQTGSYVFATVPSGRVIDRGMVVASIREAEGLSVVMHAADAAALGLDATLRCAWITLTVHSDLAAVGLTATVSTTLAEARIACNVVAGARHDHLFVPEACADDAMAVLAGLQAGSDRAAP